MIVANAQEENGEAGDYKWYTYNEFWEMVQDFASGLLHLDLVPETDGVGSSIWRSHFQYKILGVYGKNSIDWVLAEQSCNAYNFSICPVYDTLGADSVEFILQQTGMKACVCGKEETLKVGVGGDDSIISQLLTLVDKTPAFTTIIHMGPVDKKSLDIAKEHVGNVH